MVEKLVECVPNVSEGRDGRLIEQIADGVRGVNGVALLDVDPGKETNRTVITFVGDPEAVLEAAFRLVRTTAALLDMRRHHGAHSRIGATDVCPFVPVAGVTMEECAELARRLGKRVGDELAIPVYLYEAAAATPARQNLADVRKGEYEGLRAKLTRPDGKPDFGSSTWSDDVARSGATVIGARPFLIAYNVNLNTRDRRIAQDIAFAIREAGRAKRDAAGEIVRHPDGSSMKIPGLFKSIKAVGWVIPEYQRAQVSINFTNYEVAAPHDVFDACCRLASEMGARVTGSELVGLIPRDAVLRAGRHYLVRQGRSAGVPEAEIVETAIQSLGLRELAPFDPAQKIIEYRVGSGDGPLVGKTVRGFADELSTDSPAPGGGSVSALMGALAAALAGMVAQLTHGKKGHEQAREAMDDTALKAQALKDALLRDIDRDTDAFNAVMAAMRLPKVNAEQAAARDAAMSAAYLTATRVPLGVCEGAVRVLELALVAAEKGNPNSVSDAGVAGLAALAAAEGARLNVLINLPSIVDARVRGDLHAAAELAVTTARALAARVAAAVEAAMAPADGS